MKLLSSVLALALLGCGHAQASDSFTPAQVALEAGFVAALAADRAQTVDLRDFCRGRIGCTVHETNPLLGSRPSVASINRYFFSAALSHAIVSRLLPSSKRSAWQASSLALEVAVVGHNKRLGLSIHF